MSTLPALRSSEGARVMLTLSIRQPWAWLIGTCRLVDVAPRRTKRGLWHDPKQLGFVLTDAKPVPFVPCKGRLWFFEVEL